MNNFKLEKNKKYLIAVSFGPDSMSLLHMAIKQQLVIEVAHVNYHRRPESEQENKTLKQYCKSMKISFHSHDAVYKKSDGNFQNWARKIRYQYFKKVYEQSNADSLLVAHNLDDHLETAIMQKNRQINIVYMGIDDEINIYGMKVIRPLLNIRKQELLNYCNENDVPYALDKTNQKSDYLRNRIRHNVVGKMTDSKIDSLINEINEYNKAIKTKISEAKNKINQNELQTSDLLKADTKQSFILLWLLIHDKVADFKISNNFINRVKQACQSKRPHWKWKVDDKYWLIKSYDKLLVAKLLDVADYSLTIKKPQIIDTPFFYFDLTSGDCPQVISIEEYPIIIRNYQERDKIVINQVNRSVRRLFIDWKLPLEQRKTWPIFVNSKGKIIYIPRYQIDFNSTNRPNFYVKLYY